MTKKRKINLLIIFFIVCITLSKVAFCAEFKKKILMKLPQSIATATIQTISLDSRWLVMRLATSNGDKLVVIDLEKEPEKNVVYLNSSVDSYFSDFYWEDNKNLILYEYPRKYYRLEIKDSNVTFEQLENFERDKKKFPFFHSPDNDNYQYGIAEAGSIFSDFEIKGKKSKKGITLLYKSKKVTSHLPKFGFFGLQYPSLYTISRSPDGLHIFYGIQWYGGSWNSGPEYLYYLDVVANKVTKIAEKFMTYGVVLMVWSPDSKRFIYASEAKQGRGVSTEIIEMIKVK